MGFNAAYNTAKDIGTNISKGFRDAQDSNAIESILSSAMQSGNQEDLNSAIGKILSQVSPERQADAVKILQNNYNNVLEKQKINREQNNQQNKIKREDQLLLEKNNREDLLLNNKNKREDELLTKKNEQQVQINKESNVPENFDKWTLAAQKNYFDSQKPKEKTKEEIKQEEQAEGKQRAQQVFNELSDLVKGGNVGFGSGIKGSIPYLGANNAKDTGKFNSLTGGLEAILVDLVSRGTLSNARFKYITETLLPKPTDRDNEIIGKLEGLAVLLDLDASELTQGIKNPPNQQNQPNSDTVMIISPISKKPVPIPRDQVDAALQGGGRLAE